MTRTDDQPKPGELWLTHSVDQSQSDDRRFKIENSRTAIMECLGELTADEETPSHLPSASAIRESMTDIPYKGRYLYDFGNPEIVGSKGHAIAGHHWYLRLPEDPEEFDERYADLLDYVLGYLTFSEVADLLAGETTAAYGHEGYEALRTWVLTGISEGITEHSISHGHGPKRYARAVENRLDELPEWMIETVLDSEIHRWESSPLDDDRASRIVELLLLKRQYLDDDTPDEIHDLVNEFNLPYEEFLEGRFTTLDCPECGAELIERPSYWVSPAEIHLDCSDCDKQYEAVERDGDLVVERELTADEEVTDGS